MQVGYFVLLNILLFHFGLSNYSYELISMYKAVADPGFVKKGGQKSTLSGLPRIFLPGTQMLWNRASPEKGWWVVGGGGGDFFTLWGRGTVRLHHDQPLWWKVKKKNEMAIKRGAAANSPPPPPLRIRYCKVKWKGCFFNQFPGIFRIVDMLQCLLKILSMENDVQFPSLKIAKIPR